MSIFSRFFRREDPMDLLKRLVSDHDQRGGENDTLQGALAHAALCLRSEANRNGWLNGGEFHSECIDLIKRYLCDSPVGTAFPEPARLAKNLENIREAALGGFLEGRFAYEELDQLVVDIARWCEMNPTPIRHPPGEVFW
ncbi:MAG: hypothetical protein JSR82_12195 [Verrucomicrobia bacterium]|nr:hypothetical protein [Verrucomicrobiota bacterium]